MVPLIIYHCVVNGFWRGQITRRLAGVFKTLSSRSSPVLNTVRADSDGEVIQISYGEENTFGVIGGIDIVGTGNSGVATINPNINLPTGTAVTRLAVGPQDEVLYSNIQTDPGVVGSKAGTKFYITGSPFGNVWAEKVSGEDITPVVMHRVLTDTSPL